LNNKIVVTFAALFVNLIPTITSSVKRRQILPSNKFQRISILLLYFFCFQKTKKTQNKKDLLVLTFSMTSAEQSKENTFVLQTTVSLEVIFYVNDENHGILQATSKSKTHSLIQMFAEVYFVKT
jgi:hypothetical protein